MKSLYLGLSLVLTSLTTSADLVADSGKAVDATTKAEEKFIAYVKKALIPLHNNAVSVAETKKYNAKGLILNQIKKVGKKWQAAEIIKTNPAIKEAFIIGNQDAVAGENDLTSDYWQGDQAKWKGSHNKGKGGVDISKVKHNKSTSSQLQQVSIPLTDNAKVIGAITFGLDISKL